MRNNKKRNHKNLTIRYAAVEEIKAYDRNARTHSPEQIGQIARSIEEFGFVNPILLDKTGIIVAGHGRLAAAKLLGRLQVPVIDLSDLTPEQARALVIADNKLALNAGWDEELLAAELEAIGDLADLVGFSDDEMNDLLGIVTDAETAPPMSPEQARTTLADRFGLPPFSVLDARAGWWQTRKRAWISLGIRSELGRGEHAAPGGSPRPLDRMKAGKANATPGGSLMPSADYSKNRQRGNGRGKAIS